MSRSPNKLLQELKCERSGMKFNNVDSIVSVIKRVMDLYDQEYDITPKKRYDINRLRFIDDTLEDVFTNCYNRPMVRGGHFYTTYIFYRLGLVVKVLRDRERRMIDVEESEYFLRSEYKIHHGVSTFPNKRNNLSKHFVYPIWRSVGNIVYVQPLVEVDKKNADKADKFFSRLMDDGYIAPDAHIENVGIYNGKPVIFDWWHR